MRTITVADLHGADHQFFKDNGGWASPPLVILANLCKLECPVEARTITGRDGQPKDLPALPARLTSQEIHLLTQMVIYRYAFAEPVTGKDLINAVPDLRFLAEKINRSIRQVQRLLERLKLRGLVNVKERPGRPSVIDLSPTIAAVKLLLNWQEEPPADPPETLAELTSEPEQSWEAFVESYQEPEEEQHDMGAFSDWGFVKDELAKSASGVSRAAFTTWFAATEGLRWEDNILVVGVDSLAQLDALEGRFQATINLHVLDLFGSAVGVRFERKKKAKQRVQPPEPVVTR